MFNCRVDGYNNLHLAILKQDLPRVKNLVEAEGKVNEPQTRQFRYTPLMLAIFTQNMEIIKYLLDHGADPNGQDAKGETPLIQLVLSADQSKADEIEELLIKHGADINKTNKLGISFILQKKQIVRAHEGTRYEGETNEAIKVIIIN